MTTSIISQQLHTISQTLAGFLSLAPTPAVNDTFAHLVSLVTNTPDELAEMVLRSAEVQPLLSSLQSYAAAGETALEEYWAHEFLSCSVLTYEDLKGFPYFHNYEALAALEVAALRTHVSITEPILFVGGGPLPLSAIIFAQQYGLRVHIIDNNPVAVATSQALIQRLGLASSITVSNADIRAYAPQEHTIFLAAMVGRTICEKQAIYAHLATVTDPAVTIVSRSVTGLGVSLYPPKPDTIDFDDIAVYRGTREIINTVVISKKV